MNAPAIFENREFQLRITPADDSFRVEAPGLARALGFRDSHDLVRSIPEAEKGYELVRTPGGDQNVWHLTEPGFYRALGQRQTARIKDAAVRDQVVRFQGWVYGDVLPAIRRTGGYQVPQSSVPSADVATVSRRDLAQMILAEADRADAAEQRAAELEPAAEAWESLAGAQGDLSLKDAAAVLNRDPAITTGRTRLLQFLRDEGLVDRTGRPYARYSKWLVERMGTWQHPSGEDRLYHAVRVTPAGVEYLRRRMGGIRAVAA